MKYCRNYRKCDYALKYYRDNGFIIVCTYRDYCIYQEEEWNL